MLQQMYKQDNVRRLLESYKITLTKRTMQKRYRSTFNFSINDPYGYDQYDHDPYIQEEVVPSLVVELEESSLLQIADKIAEFDDLMRDPETAKLLMEARFINRLKGNR